MTIPVVQVISNTLDKATARSLNTQIMGTSTSSPVAGLRLTVVRSSAAYEYLVKTCKLTPVRLHAVSCVARADKEGDKICLFGFSHGAHLVRALAGMLDAVGLLPPCNSTS